MSMKPRYAKNHQSKNMKAYKYKQNMNNRDSYQIDELVSMSPKIWWSSHQNILDSDVSNVVFIKLKCIHHQDTKSLTSCETPYLHKKNMNDFWYPKFFGSMGVSTSPNPNIFTYKIGNIYSIIAKSCKMVFAAATCTSAYSSIHGVMCVSIRSMCMP